MIDDIELIVDWAMAKGVDDMNVRNAIRRINVVIATAKHSERPVGSGASIWDGGGFFVSFPDHAKISAIKQIRQLWGCGLKEAKQYVEFSSCVANPRSPQMDHYTFAMTKEERVAMETVEAEFRSFDSKELEYLCGAYPTKDSLRTPRSHPMW